MPNFPKEKGDEKPERTHWSVWRGDKWLGEYIGTRPNHGAKIKPKECLTKKKVVSFNLDLGRIFVE